MDRETARQQWLAWAAANTRDPAQQARMVEAALAAMDAGAGPDVASANAMKALQASASPQPQPPKPTGRVPGLGLPKLTRLDQALVGALVLAVIAMAAVASSLISANSARPAGATAAAHSSAPTNAALLAFIPEAKRFVEAHRGLKYTSDVPIEFLTDQDFVKRLQGQSKADPQALAVFTKEYRALGLISPTTDLGQAATTFTANGIIGLYDYQSKHLWVRGVDPTPRVKATLVHELTHALQDQHFKLSRIAAFNTDETSTAFRAVVEGDAVRVEQAYVATLSAADKAAYNAPTSATPLPADSTPQALVLAFSFPYVAGPAFVNTILTVHGQAALDQAFIVPPSTTAQVIHVDKFLNEARPQPVSPPPSDAKPFDQGEFGELGLRIILYQAYNVDHSISRGDYDNATQGWAGDRYAAWDAGAGRACVRGNFLMDNVYYGNALLVAFRKVVAAHKGWSVGVNRYGEVALTACG